MDSTFLIDWRIKSPMRKSETGGAEQVEAGLLFLVLELDPEHLSLADLTRRMSEKSSRGEEGEASRVAHRPPGAARGGGQGPAAPDPAGGCSQLSWSKRPRTARFAWHVRA